MDTARIARLFVLTSALVALCAGHATAQYFGSNKVRYKRFEFQVLRGEL